MTYANVLLYIGQIERFFFWISKKTFIIGVVQASVETALNSSGDVFFTATAEEFDGRKRE